MRVQLIFSILIISFAFPGNLWAEFYRYTGKDGAIHFTDDLSQVPVDQREQVEAYTGAPTPTSEVQETPQVPEAASKAKQAISLLEGQRQSLVKRQDALKAEYDRLMSAKAEIEAMRQTADTPEKIQALQEKQTALKADIAQYETQTKALQEEVAGFNEAVKTSNAAKEGEAPKP